MRILVRLEVEHFCYMKKICVVCSLFEGLLVLRFETNVSLNPS
jgi:hypothetical protein